MSRHDSNVRRSAKRITFNAAAGFTGLNFSWLKDGAPIDVGADPRLSILSTDRATTLMVAAPTLDDLGEYRVRVTNACGQSLSPPAVIDRVCPADVDGSGFVDVDDFVAFTDRFSQGCVAPLQSVMGPTLTCGGTADMNADGSVDSDDFVQFLASFDTPC